MVGLLSLLAYLWCPGSAGFSTPSSVEYIRVGIETQVCVVHRGDSYLSIGDSELLGYVLPTACGAFFFSFVCSLGVHISTACSSSG